MFKPLWMIHNKTYRSLMKDARRAALVRYRLKFKKAAGVILALARRKSESSRRNR